ncbi:MAG TPA: IS481 family transposase [Kofleriaceae bacterium]|jgi:transposase InsO family protein
MRRLYQNERLVDLCAEYGISEKTARKFKRRFEQRGLPGLVDQSRAPLHIPHKTRPELEAMLIAERNKHPTWGPKKLKAVLEKRHGRAFPAASTIGEVLKRAGLVSTTRRTPTFERLPTTLTIAKAANDLWCIDFKGQFRLGDASYCYPLTVTDQFSRYLLGVEAMPGINTETARDVCEELFRQHGLPRAIRSDNGAPFASRGLAGLTKLSAYWMLLGIRLERIRPAHPQENGRHERMHRTLKLETASPPHKNLLQQQQRFDDFIAEYNNERPHEAVELRCPADLYRASPRMYPAVLPTPKYVGCDDVLKVNSSGCVYLGSKHQAVFVSEALCGLPVGVTTQPDGRLRITFCDLILGHIDLAIRKLVRAL